MATKDRENYTGTDEYGAFVRRILRTYARRAKTQDVDIEALRQLETIRLELDTQIAETVSALRSEAGGRHSWTQIGDALNISRGQALRRYGHLDDGTVRRIGGQPHNLR